MAHTATIRDAPRTLTVTVDQHCPSCGTHIDTSGTIVGNSGVGFLRRLKVEWDCRSCGVSYDREATIDTAQIDRFGFESWVGDIEDEPVCIIVEYDGGTGGSGHKFGSDVDDSSVGAD